MANDFNYIMNKVDHLKRAGLVGPKSTGLGMNGGAAPDWLIAEQQERNKVYAKRRAQQWAAQFRTAD